MRTGWKDFFLFFHEFRDVSLMLIGPLFAVMLFQWLSGELKIVHIDAFFLIALCIFVLPIPMPVLLRVRK